MACSVAKLKVPAIFARVMSSGSEYRVRARSALFA